MSEKLKDKLLLEIAQDLVLKFDTEISKDILNIINKHLYNYDVVEKQTSLITLDTKTERILKMYLGTKKTRRNSNRYIKTILQRNATTSCFFKLFHGRCYNKWD